MWKFFGGLLGGLRMRGKTAPTGIDSVFAALNEGEAKRPPPTLVCRQCGLKYVNTGTYLQGSRCPDCHPSG
ncbi:MAG TPA: hypothetical protein VFE35_05800 [Candidatus Cybelea sp.]|jgi:hypothetical protein|nr:hypothetical protein [Candidatus Cybelea sp.]